MERFVFAQAGGVHERALAELEAGRKQSHWMWFVFPQLRGLGLSETSQYFGIAGSEEAREYLNHELLGPRLVEAAAATLRWAGRRSVEAIFGHPDDQKLRSSATLFASVSAPGSVFHQLLDAFFEGESDAKTLSMLGNHQR